MKANKVKQTAVSGDMANANEAKNVKHPVRKGILIATGVALGLAAAGIVIYSCVFYGAPKDKVNANIHDNDRDSIISGGDQDNYYEHGSGSDSTAKDEANSEEENKAENDPNRNDPLPDPDAGLDMMLNLYNTTRDSLGLNR